MLLYIGGTKVGKSANILLVSKCGGNPVISPKQDLVC